MKVAILLASYNGEKFIREQIESLLVQSYQNITIYIRDDGSTDGTYAIEKEYEQQYPNKIFVQQRTEGKGGSKYNFWELCKTAVHTGINYFMFCDQDDVWNNDKVEISLKAMLDMEGKDKTVPVLVHTDLLVVDQKLNALGESFVRYRALNTNCKSINRLLVQNNATGCTMLFNRALLEKALKLQDLEGMVLHDWWLTLVASVFGNIEFVDIPTIQYRQHGGNVVGATKVNTIPFILKRLVGKNHVRETLQKSSTQAFTLLNTYRDELPEKDRRTITAFADIENQTKLTRIWLLLKYRLLKQGIVQVVGQIVFI